MVGVDDERWGQRVCAAVVVREQISADDLVDFCSNRLAGFKRPRHIEFWGELPKSSVGKSLRRTVRDTMGQTREVENA